MEKLIPFLIFICILPTSAFADTFLGVYVGAGFWNQETSGRVLKGVESGIVREFLELRKMFG